jgi:hypothetical protein
MSTQRRRLADAGFGVLHSDELRRRDWPSIDGALADSVLEVRLAEDESRHFVRGNPSIAVGEALFSVVALAGGEDAQVEPRVEAALTPARFPGLPPRRAPHTWRWGHAGRVARSRDPRVRRRPAAPGRPFRVAGRRRRGGWSLP